MRLKIKLVLAISGMVMALVATLSSIYLSQMVRQRVNAEYDKNQETAQVVLHAVQDALDADYNVSRVDLDDPESVRQAVEEALQTDAGLNSLIEAYIGSSKTLFDIAVTDNSGRVMLSSNTGWVGKAVEQRPDFDEVRRGSITRQVQIVYGKSKFYEVRLPLVAPQTQKPLGTIRVVISTSLLEADLKPQINRAVTFSGIAVFVSLLLAAGLSNLALRPLVAISRRLDLVSAGAVEPAPEAAAARRDEVGVVTTKIERLGRQFRDVKEVFSALKENLDQIMANLQDGLVLFTRDSRAVLVSASAEHFLGRPRGDILGHSVEEIFSRDQRLGRLVLAAFEARQPVELHELETEDSHRIQVSLDFIEERGESIGALLTMRDAESVQRIESEIELSRRLAAIGRLTSGVAHEVKNPINAIVVHLEILRQKMAGLDSNTRRHVEVIGSEIARLDRVVQLLVDFTRPVELRLVEMDLRRLVEDVALLAAPEAEQRGVRIERSLPAEPLSARVDADLVKQALLNVVLNGVQAMPDGGSVRLTAAQDARGIELEVRDQGPGIAPEIRERIFDLYFTTKEKGSGIGLAMTFRVMQLHNGSVEFDSRAGEGTVFRLRFPMAEARPEPAREVAAQG